MGPYDVNEVRKRMEDNRLDGTEFAWREGLGEWIPLREAINSIAPGNSLSAEEVAPKEGLDEVTQDQLRKIEELISDGHVDTAAQLVQSLNNPKIYEEILKDCPVDINGFASPSECFHEHGGLFIKLLCNIPEEVHVQPALRESLDLSARQISDLAPLTGLAGLKKLRLELNQVTNLTHLMAFTQLEELRASYNEIDNLVPLSHLPSLRRLGLGGNKITDLTPIGGLVNLEKLWLQENQITDLTPLHGLKALETVFLNGNPDLSEDNIQQLHESLPECQIVSDPADF